MNDPQTWTDPDKYVRVTLTGDDVSIAVTRAGFTRPPQLLTELILELASNLPAPGSDTDQALADSAAALDGLGQAFAQGGWLAFDKAMRERLGLDPAPTPIPADPETDAVLGRQLGNMLKGIEGATSPDRPTTTLSYEAATPEGDLAVTTSTARVVESLRIGLDARHRGVEGLGTTLTALVAEARAELAKQADFKLREELPEQLITLMDTTPKQAEQAGKAATAAMNQAAQLAEAVKRKAGRA